MVNNGGAFAALLTDLSKTFDCILHENAIISRLKAFLFTIDALELAYEYLSHKKQRVNINEAFFS